MIDVPAISQNIEYAKSDGDGCPLHGSQLQLSGIVTRTWGRGVDDES